MTGAWQDGRLHDGRDATFHSDLQTVGTFRVTFTSPGVYDYVCSVHPAMIGRIVVTGSTAGSR